ncbi:glycosylphosphatidylinositol-anchored lipid protein transfer 7 [Hibiscus trionum]|uniref:Glycosylphosphatidylinositol-anchored lipid protein transfer 7 n=1 Tax=Hibiscus trionum TaxID=183268 RepID=A0A9W7HIB5_HIBTR|nr:glycosylphosphatidylinositol-anchored lipid protein transfer 7 [Hibiscus trionum]
MAMFLMIAVLVLLGSMATLTDAQTTCAQKLVYCSPYLNNATAKPRDDCCDPIREAVANELPCLCNLYNDSNLLNSLNVTVPEALRVSRECGITTDLSACNATSPTSAPFPPGQTGGAGSIALAGVTTLFLFLATFIYSSGL